MGRGLRDGVAKKRSQHCRLTVCSSVKTEINVGLVRDGREEGLVSPIVRRLEGRRLEDLDDEVGLGREESVKLEEGESKNSPLGRSKRPNGRHLGWEREALRRRSHRSCCIERVNPSSRITRAERAHMMKFPPA